MLKSQIIAVKTSGEAFLSLTTEAFLLGKEFLHLSRSSDADALVATSVPYSQVKQVLGGLEEAFTNLRASLAVFEKKAEAETHEQVGKDIRAIRDLIGKLDNLVFLQSGMDALNEEFEYPNHESLNKFRKVFTYIN